jgi:hypothetical protein
MLNRVKDTRHAGTARTARASPSEMRKDLQEEEFESRWEAAPAVVLLIATQVVLALLSRQAGWQLWIFPWWAWLIPVVPETLLLMALALDGPRRQLEQMGLRRTVALSLLGLISVATMFLVLSLVASLLSGFEHNGAELLLKAIAVWTTNVITFGLWFWGLDRGGPVRRLQRDELTPDFLFPQMDDPQVAPPHWRPRLLDYMYVSFTNSIAFSPTDAMPLTHVAKSLMLVESAVSAMTLVLLTARAVNILV